MARFFMAIALVAFLLPAGCAGVDKTAVREATDSEVELMAKLSAYIDADTKKSDELKAAEKSRIKAHLDLINALRR